MFCGFQIKLIRSLALKNFRVTGTVKSELESGKPSHSLIPHNAMHPLRSMILSGDLWIGK